MGSPADTSLPARSIDSTGWYVERSPAPGCSMATTGVPATNPTKATRPAPMDAMTSPGAAAMSMPRWPRLHSCSGGSNRAVRWAGAMGQDQRTAMRRGVSQVIRAGWATAALIAPWPIAVVGWVRWSCRLWIVVPSVESGEDVASGGEHLVNGEHLVMGRRPDGLDWRHPGHKTGKFARPKAGRCSCTRCSLHRKPRPARVRTVPLWRVRARRSVRGIGQPARCQRTGARRQAGAP
jgi:hypothetical protein